LQLAVDFVKSCSGLNAQRDIELLFLEQADRSLWEGMQTAAEEKKKV